MFKHPLVGRLGLVVGVLALASACGGGEISDVPTGARLGPEASGDGEICSSDACIDAPATSSNWWEIVTEPDATNTGPNCSAPGCPSATLLPGNAPPQTVTQDGAVYENFTMSTGEDPIFIQADNVTFRNFHITNETWRGIEMVGTSTNLILEYGEIVGDALPGFNCAELIQGEGWTGRHLDLSDCDDGLKVGGEGAGPTVLENSYLHRFVGGHGDAIMLWPAPIYTSLFKHNSLEGGNTAVFIPDDIIGAATITENWMYGNGTQWGVYCVPQITVQDNLWSRTGWNGGLIDDAGCTAGGNLYMDDFSPTPYNP